MLCLMFQEIYVQSRWTNSAWRSQVEFSQKDGEKKGNSMCEGSNGYDFGTCEVKHKARHDALPQGTGKAMGVLTEKL